MITVFTWPLIVRNLITILFVLCVLLQTLAIIMSFYRYPRSQRRTFETLLELAVLLQVFIGSLIHGQAMQGFLFGMIPQTGYVASRIVIFIVIILLAITVIVLTRKPWPLLAIGLTSLTVPLAEQLAGGIFAYLFVSAIVFWLVRSVVIALSRFKVIKNGISVLSIKNAIDSLHTGILFNEPDGHILLYNTQMQRLITIITGEVHRNISVFNGLISSGEVMPGCKKTELGGQSVVLLPDASAWMFTKTEIQINNRAYTQITATDITQRWKLTAELNRQHDELTLKGENINEMIANLHILSREQETQKAKMRAHDILGERLTLLLRTIRNEQTLDYDLLRSLTRGFMDELKSGQAAPVPQDELDNLRQVFKSIGVTIALDGHLPEDAIGLLFTDIIREGASNSVKHGFATEVSVQISTSEDVCRLTITDNGRSVSDTYSEGGGIRGIRNKLKPYGGELTVASYPGFILSIILPGGDTHI